MLLPFYEILENLTEFHLLIAGSTGSGKSVAISGIIYQLLFRSPAEARLVLIDPKRVELVEYSGLPHAVSYASEPAEIVSALNWAVNEMERRYKRMQAERLKKSTESDIFIIIDEFADLMTTNKKACVEPLTRLSQLGRAANIKLICATQNCTTKVLDTRLKSNFANRLALRTAFGYESRNIIGVTGCEFLEVGEAYHLQGCRCEKIKIPLIDGENITKMLNYWKIKEA